MFKKKKKNEVRDGAKVFESKINTIEFIFNKKSEKFTRPQVVDKVFLNESLIEEFINACSTNNFINKNFNKTTPSEVYINGININQVSKTYLDEIKIVASIKQEQQLAIVNKLCFEKLENFNLTIPEKIELSEIYKQNPSVVIFNNFKVDLNEKEFEKLQQSIINLFCDSIIIFAKTK